MGIVELFETGFFTVFWDWSSPILTGIFYLGVIIGVFLQILLRKKFKNPTIKWLIRGFCGFCITISVVICECLWHNITGWDRLGVIVVYGFVISIILGAIIATVISLFVKGKR